jgi:hypothetical protein
MSIDVPLKDHKRIKVLAAAEGASIREFVIECIHERIYPAKTPNKKTHKAIEDARKGKTKKAKNFDDLCEQLGI